MHVVGICHLFDGLILSRFAGNELGIAHDDACGVEVIVEGFALSEELGCKQQVELCRALLCIFEVEVARIAHRNGGFDDHRGRRIDAENLVDDLFYVGGVEIVFRRVVVRWRGNHHKVGIFVGHVGIQCGRQSQGLLAQILLDVIVLNGRLAMVDEVNLFGNDVNGRHFVVLCQQGGHAEPHISGAGDSNF